MTKCDHCGKTILLGGVKQADLRFCATGCQEAHGVTRTLADYPPDAIEEAVRQIHEGACPRCAGPGPVDAHTTHRVWSAVYLTRWSNETQLSCKKCGTKRQLQSILFSSLLGWWGFPHGLIQTPIRIGLNIRGIYRKPGLSQHGDWMIRRMLAQHWGSAPKS